MKVDKRELTRTGKHTYGASATGLNLFGPPDEWPDLITTEVDDHEVTLRKTFADGTGADYTVACSLTVRNDLAANLLDGSFAKPLEYWEARHGEAAAREGWCLSEAGGATDIERIDNQVDDCRTDEEEAERLRTHAQLDDDLQALDVVMRGVAGRSVMHLLALYLDGRAADEWVYIPESLRSAPAAKKEGE